MPYANGAKCPHADKGRCPACAAVHAAREAERRAERKANGLCAVCGAKASPSKLAGGVKRVKERATLCSAHLQYYAERQSS